MDKPYVHFSKRLSKVREGQLSDAERAEYATAVAAIEFISVLQAKARRLLSQTPA
jgi:hypothetical protein